MNEITADVLDSSITVHRAFGPAVWELIYARALAIELRQRGRKADLEWRVPVSYRGVDLGPGFRVDLLVDDEVVVEVKAVEQLHPLHETQLLTYLQLTGKRVGLLINFHVGRLIDGFHRFVR